MKLQMKIMRARVRLALLNKLKSKMTDRKCAQIKKQRKYIPQAKLSALSSEEQERYRKDLIENRLRNTELVLKGLNEGALKSKLS